MSFTYEILNFNLKVHFAQVLTKGFRESCEY